MDAFDFFAVMKLLDRRSVLVSLVASGLLVACNSPTLPPLPPPNEPRVIQHMGDGEVLLEGSIPVEEAKLLVLNTHNDEIVGVFTHDGGYSVLVRAEPGDFIHLWYSTAGVDSPLARFSIPPRPEELEEQPSTPDGSEGAGADDAEGAEPPDATEPDGSSTAGDAGCACTCE